MAAAAQPPPSPPPRKCYNLNDNNNPHYGGSGYPPPPGSRAPFPQGILSLAHACSFSRFLPAVDAVDNNREELSADSTLSIRLDVSHPSLRRRPSTTWTELLKRSDDAASSLSSTLDSPWWLYVSSFLAFKQEVFWRDDEATPTHK